jgi:hypothetical protein
MTDQFGVFRDARQRVRETAKWVVTILGSALVLVVGGGLLADIPSLDTPRMFIAGGALVALLISCAYPLTIVIEMIASPFRPFHEIIADKEFDAEIARADAYLKSSYPTKFGSVKRLQERRDSLLAELASAPKWTRRPIELERERVEAVIREVIELLTIWKLESRFNSFKSLMKRMLILFAVSLLLLLGALHGERQTNLVDRIGAATPPSDYFVTFASGQTCSDSNEDLAPRSSTTGETVGLDEMAAVIREAGATVLRVVGSTDSQVLGPESQRTFGNNVSLALSRAHCVAGRLQSGLATRGIYIQTAASVRGPSARTETYLDRAVEIRLLP